jgi:CHAT domain-containing protein
MPVRPGQAGEAATTELMIRFYQRLLGPDHLSPAAALREAQLSMMKETRWRHPYFWAPFTVEGDWRVCPAGAKTDALEKGE